MVADPDPNPDPLPVDGGEDVSDALGDLKSIFTRYREAIVFGGSIACHSNLLRQLPQSGGSRVGELTAGMQVVVADWLPEDQVLIINPAALEIPDVTTSLAQIWPARDPWPTPYLNDWGIHARWANRPVVRIPDEDLLRAARRRYRFSRPRPLPIDGFAYRARSRSRRKK